MQDGISLTDKALDVSDAAELRTLFERLAKEVSTEEEALWRARQQAERLAQAKQDAEEACESMKTALESTDLQCARVRAAAAGTAVRAIRKKDLEELRSMLHPPKVVEHTLALLHSILTPEAYTEEELSKGFHVLATRLRWKEDLRPMLAASLAERIAEFPPAGQPHPLIEQPALLAMLQLQIIEEGDVGCDDFQSQQVGMRSKSVGGAGSFAARLLRASKSSSNISANAHHTSAKNKLAEVSPASVSRMEGRGSLAARSLESQKYASNLMSEATAELNGLALSVVCRASMPVGSLFQWIVAQVRLANALPPGGVFVTASDETAHIAETEAAATKAESACQALQSIQELMALHDASSGILAPSEARRLLARAAQPGPDGAEAKNELNIALSHMATLKARLGEMRHQKSEAVQALELKVEQLRERSSSLESTLQEAETAQEQKREADLAAQGPALCDCEPPEEMIIRQVTALNNEDFGRWYWVCAKPVRRRCGRKFFDDSVSRNSLELLEKMKGGL